MKRKKKKRSGYTAVERFVKGIDLPEFAAGRDECVEIWGGNTVVIEGARGIHTYEQELVRIRMKKYCLVIRGADFDLARFGDGCLRVTGQLKQLEWEG